MTEKKRYFSVDYDEEYYIFDSTKISKEEVLEQAEYSYDVFADSLTSSEIVELLNENEELKKEYYQMRNLYFENAEDICDNCKHRYLVEVKDIHGYYHQKCKKGYSECPKGTVTYCGDFELKGDSDD